MSWNDVASNQTVSGVNLNDAVTTGQLSAKTSIPYDNKQVTSDEAYSYVNIYPTGLPGNQLPVKGAFSAYTSNPVYNFRVFGIGAENGISMPYHSENGGVTWAKYTAAPEIGYLEQYIQYSCIAASSNGQYVAIGSAYTQNSFYLSSNSGASFNNISFPDPIGYFPNPQIYSIDMSESGQVIAVMISSGAFNAVTISVSTNYGASFTTSTVFKDTNVFGASVTVSGNGRYISYVAYNGFSNYSWRVFSSNYGASFTMSGNSTNQLFFDICSSYDGKYQLITNYGTASTGNIFVSSNYGGLFSGKSTYGGGAYCAMDRSGQSMTVSKSASTSIAYSYNYGAGWASKVIGTSGTYGLTSSDTQIVPYANSYAAIALGETFLYAPTNGFVVAYTQPVTYGVSIGRIFKKSFRI